MVRSHEVERHTDRDVISVPCLGGDLHMPDSLRQVAERGGCDLPGLVMPGRTASPISTAQGVRERDNNQLPTLSAVDAMGWKPDETVFISGIGCSSRAPGYIITDSLHTTHGGALAFATGVKLARPSLHVVIFTGDGDLAAIGGNHFIHACRRNIDLTVVCMNNQIYGMTGGQGSPTTPRGALSTTTPYGANEMAPLTSASSHCGGGQLRREVDIIPCQGTDQCHPGGP